MHVMRRHRGRHLLLSSLGFTSCSWSIRGGVTPIVAGGVVEV